MMSRTSSAPLLAPASLRGVYRCRKLIDGRPAWYAFTSQNELLPPGIRVVREEETEAQVAAELVRALRLLDPVRPALQLLRDDDLTRDAAVSPGTFVRLLRHPLSG